MIKKFIDKLYQIKWRVKDGIRFIKGFVWHRHHILKLRKWDGTWMDADHKLELAIEKIFFDFIEREKPFEALDWDFDKTHRDAKRELLNAYDWFKTLRAEKQKTVDELEDKLFGGIFNIELLNKKDEIFDRRFKVLQQLEKEITDENTKQYTIIIKNRGSLWT